MTHLPLSEAGLPAGPSTFLELAEVYRRRWEIEVCFQLVQQPLRFDPLTRRCENGIRRVWDMSLIAAGLLLWDKRLSGIDRGGRWVKGWLADKGRLWTQQMLANTVFQPDG